MLIDLANLQWWQALIGIAGVLGLSPAPWLLGMARGKIQFTGLAQAEHQARTDDLKAHHAAAVAELVRHYEAELKSAGRQLDEMRESRDYYRAARLEEVKAREALTEQLVESTEVGRLAVHALQSLEVVAREASTA